MYVCMYAEYGWEEGDEVPQWAAGIHAVHAILSIYICKYLCMYVCMYVVLRSHLHEPRGGHSGADGGAVAESGHRIQQGRVPILRQL